MGDLQKIEEKKITVVVPAVNTVEEIDEHIQPMDVREVSFDKETYKVIYNEKQSESITQNILRSDKALEDYYKEHDDSKLRDLRSKSFLNLPGKKSERKKLRKEYLKSIGEKEVQYKALNQYIDEKDAKKYNAGEKLSTYNTYNKDVIMEIERANLMEEIRADYHTLGLAERFDEEKLKKMNFVQITRYKKMIGNLAEEKEKTNNFTRLVDESKEKLDKLLKWQENASKKLEGINFDLAEEQYNAIKEELGFEDAENLSREIGDIDYYSQKLYISLQMHFQKLREEGDPFSTIGMHEKYSKTKVPGDKSAYEIMREVSEKIKVPFPFEQFRDKITNQYIEYKDQKEQERLKAEKERLKAEEEEDKIRQLEEEKAKQEKKQWAEQVKAGIPKMEKLKKTFVLWTKFMTKKVQAAGLDPEKLEALVKQYKLDDEKYAPDTESMDSVKLYPEHLKKCAEFYFRISNYQDAVVQIRMDTLNNIWNGINAGLKDGYEVFGRYKDARKMYDAVKKELDEIDDQFAFMAEQIEAELDKWRAEHKEEDKLKREEEKAREVQVIEETDYVDENIDDDDPEFDLKYARHAVREYNARFKTMVVIREAIDQYRALFDEVRRLEEAGAKEEEIGKAKESLAEFVEKKRKDKKQARDDYDKYDSWLDDEEDEVSEKWRDDTKGKMRRAKELEKLLDSELDYMEGYGDFSKDFTDILDKLNEKRAELKELNPEEDLTDELFDKEWKVLSDQRQREKEEKEEAERKEQERLRLEKEAEEERLRLEKEAEERRLAEEQRKKEEAERQRIELEKQQLEEVRRIREYKKKFIADQKAYKEEYIVKRDAFNAAYREFKKLRKAAGEKPTEHQLNIVFGATEKMCKLFVATDELYHKIMDPDFQEEYKVDEKIFDEAIFYELIHRGRKHWKEDKLEINHENALVFAKNYRPDEDNVIVKTFDGKRKRELFLDVRTEGEMKKRAAMKKRDEENEREEAQQYLSFAWYLNLDHSSYLTELKRKHLKSEDRVEFAKYLSNRQINKGNRLVMQGTRNETEGFGAVENQRTFKLPIERISGEEAEWVSQEGEPLFGESGEIKLMDIKHTDEFLSPFLASVMGLAEKNPDYVRNTLIRDVKGDPSKVEVRLYDETHQLQVITLEKKSLSCYPTNERPLWLQLVERAAAIMLRSTGSESCAIKEMKNTKESREPEGVDLEVTKKASFQIASQLLYGLSCRALTTKESLDSGEYETVRGVERSKSFTQRAGDMAIGQALTYAKAGMLVTGVTCTKRGDNYHYNKTNDSVCFPVNQLKGNHSYVILGEGEMEQTKKLERTIRIRDLSEPGLFSEMEIPFGMFQMCFTDIYITSPAGEEGGGISAEETTRQERYKKELQDNPLTEEEENRFGKLSDDERRVLLDSYYFEIRDLYDEYKKSFDEMDPEQHNEIINKADKCIEAREKELLRAEIYLDHLIEVYSWDAQDKLFDRTKPVYDFVKRLKGDIWDLKKKRPII